jgi:hypothetical protein
MNFKLVFNKHLYSYKTGNLGFLVMALVYGLLPWFTSGSIDETLAIFGIMFFTIGVMRAKGSNTVLGGLLAGFIGIIYLFALAGIIPLATLWTLAILFTIGFFIFELNVVKFGPTTQRSDAFQMVPLTILSFILILGIVGYGNLVIFNMSDIMAALNYLAITVFCILSMFQVAGWSLMGKTTNRWITILALVAAATAFMDIYGISLMQWR